MIKMEFTHMVLLPKTHKPSEIMPKASEKILIFLKGIVQK